MEFLAMRRMSCGMARPATGGGRAERHLPAQLITPTTDRRRSLRSWARPRQRWIGSSSTASCGGPAFRAPFLTSAAVMAVTSICSSAAAFRRIAFTALICPTSRSSDYAGAAIGPIGGRWKIARKSPRARLILRSCSMSSSMSPTPCRRRPGHQDAQPRLLGCETVQEAMVGRLPYPAPLDVVRRRHSAASARAKRPYRPVLRLSNRAWIVDELVSSRRQIQFTPAKPELGELVRAAQGLANAGRLYRLGYCPKALGVPTSAILMVGQKRDGCACGS